MGSDIVECSVCRREYEWSKGHVCVKPAKADKPKDKVQVTCQGDYEPDPGGW